MLNKGRRETMIKAIFYSKDKEGNYTIEVESGTFRSLDDVRLRALSLNWVYRII